MKKLVAALVFFSILLLMLPACSTASTPITTPTTPTGTLTGVVSWQTQGAGNVMVVGVTVNVWGTGNTKVAYGVTDSTGRYTILNIPAGTGYLVTCYQSAGSSGGSIDEKNWLFQNIMIPSGGQTELDLTFDNAIQNAVLPDIYRD